MGPQRGSKGQSAAAAPAGHHAAQDEGLAGLRPGARILGIRLRSMGDTVLLTPALRLLHEWRPDLEVSVLVERPWDELLEGNPAIHSVWTLGGRLTTACAT